MDWYGLVPKDFVENLKFRVKTRKQCESDPVFRKAIFDACREDVLFFFSAFCFLHEPRPMRDSQGRLLPEVIPFIPWTHQEPLIRKIREHLGFEDIGVEKSRGEGMTWIALLMALHDWIFAIPGTRMVTIGIASRTVEMLDTPGDMNTLFPKLDWELDRLPKWMVGKKNVDYRRLLKDHTLVAQPVVYRHSLRNHRRVPQNHARAEFDDTARAQVARQPDAEPGALSHGLQRAGGGRSGYQPASVALRSAEPGSDRVVLPVAEEGLPSGKGRAEPVV